MNSGGTDEIVGQIVQRLGSNRSPCFLVEIPPGCEEQPDVVSRIGNSLRERPALWQRCVSISADGVADETAFALGCTRGWGEGEPALVDVARSLAASHRAGDLDAPLFLKAFLGSCGRTLPEPRILLVRNFHKLFLHMSRPLLAALRDLEQDMLLLTVNGSALPYDELYRRRARSDPSFTSDYGQTHARLTVRTLTRDEAWERSRRRFDSVSTKAAGAPDGRLSTAYFQTAYDLAGGLSGVFERACSSLEQMVQPGRDLRVYRAHLMKDLGPYFERILRYDSPESTNDTVVLEAVAEAHLGLPVPKRSAAILRGHRWSHLLLADSGTGAIRLRSDALGAQALRMLAESPGLRHVVDPTTLYRRGEFKACWASLRSRRGVGGTFDLLSAASEMMDAVFGDAPGSLYFGPEVPWSHVLKLAQRGAEMCHPDAAKVEFRAWGRIALAMDRASNAGPARKVEACDVEPEFIRLAVRILAVQGDGNPITAAYTAIPLLEDVLRGYLRLVLNVEPEAAAFDDVEESTIEQLWDTQPDAFRRPTASKRLAGVEIAVLAAALARQREKPLFESAKDLSALRGQMDATRNLASHYVIVPSQDQGRSLAITAGHLLDRLAVNAGVSLTLESIKDWVRPPMRFLEEAPAGVHGA